MYGKDMQYKFSRIKNDWKVPSLLLSTPQCRKRPAIGFKLEAKSLSYLGSADHKHPRHLNPLIVEDENVSFGVEAQTHRLLQLTIAWGVVIR